MNDKEGENPSRDELLLQLLRTPPQPRAERKRPRKAKLTPSRTLDLGASAEIEGERR
jgi:hypothetical protein